MSALTNFRDHCRAMVAATRERPVTLPGEGRCWPSEDERGLWARLADEVDDYLAGQLGEDIPRHVDQDGFDFGGDRA